MRHLIGQCEQAQTWEEARLRVAIYCDENRAELANLDVFPHECLTVAKVEIWPRIAEDRKRIYLGFQFL
jgi:hypothetical protein